MKDEAKERALSLAFERKLETILTEPLKVCELAKWFRVHRSKVVSIVRPMKGAFRVGHRWRVPLLSMPPAFLQERGFLPFAEGGADRSTATRMAGI